MGSACYGMVAVMSTLLGGNCHESHVTGMVTDILNIEGEFPINFELLTLEYEEIYIWSHDNM